MAFFYIFDLLSDAFAAFLGNDAHHSQSCEQHDHRESSFLLFFSLNLKEDIFWFVRGEQAIAIW